MYFYLKFYLLNCIYLLYDIRFAFYSGNFYIFETVIYNKQCLGIIELIKEIYRLQKHFIIKRNIGLLCIKNLEKLLLNNK